MRGDVKLLASAAHLAKRALVNAMHDENTINRLV